MTLDDLSKLCEAATPGPWFVGARDLDKHTCGPMNDTVATLDFSYGDDADFIAAARTYMPLLIEVAKNAALWLEYHDKTVGTGSMSASDLQKWIAFRTMSREQTRLKLKALEGAES